jgi:hypothetical protein
MIEGRDFVLEERYADGDETRLQSLAAELIGMPEGREGQV